MTPLAHEIAKDSTLPRKKRLFTVDRGSDVPVLIRKSHCFELTEIRDTVWAMLHDMVQKNTLDKNGKVVIPVDDALAFLPAPITWLEWTDATAFGGPGRVGILLEESGNFAIGTVCTSSDKHFCTASQIIMPLRRHENLDNLAANFSAGELKIHPSENGSEGRRANCLRLTAFAFIALAFINTPRIIGRRQHMPNVGLERRLAKSLGMVGRFPLHAWTEIKLEIGTPRDLSDDGEHEAHLTGQKALHFCRQHIRIKMGKLELVRAHWRGNPALGIKQSRYKLTRPSTAMADRQKLTVMGNK